MAKKLIGIAIIAIMLFGVFGLTACDNVSLEEYKNAVGTSVEKTKDAIDIGYYEIEVDDMVDCSLFSFFPNRSWIGNPIKLKFAEENVSFHCIVDKGIFSTTSQYAKKITLKSGDGFHWLPYELDQKGQFTSKNKIERAFVEIILKTDENIIGYALVEVYPITEYCFSFKAKTLKSAIFPKIEGEYQSVSEDQVKKIINAIITDNGD